jgi:SPP1 gp7 family putative phage head morphogenesis protein
VASAAIAESAPSFAAWQDDIAKAIGGASDAAGAAAALDAWAQKASRDTAIVDSIYESTLLANMGGQLQVRVVEVPEAGGRRSNAPRAPFLSLPFDEAIDDFRSRAIVTPEEWRRMDAAARARAFTAAGLAADSLREHAYERLLAALQDGSTLRDFAAQLRSQEISLGVTPSDPAYVDTIFRTNIGAAYGSGRLMQLASAPVLAARPYVQIRATIDGRTTSTCRYLDGLVFNRATDPGWSKYAAPNHFNCRTTEVALSSARVSPSQVIRSDSVDARGEPAPGFDGPPTLALD